MRHSPHKKDNFTYLLVSLIFLLFSSACAEEFIAHTSFIKLLIPGLTVITMFIGIWSMKSNRLAFESGLVLLLGTIIISAGVVLLDDIELEYLHLLFMLIFFITTLKIAAQQVLFSGEVNKNTIIGSICIFLLLGLIWAIIYLLIDEFLPNSFYGLKGNNWQENFPDLIYFSFVSITTLGFGDIIPSGSIARFWVYSEAIVGVFYMAIIVSSLIGAIINNHDREAN